MYNKYFDVHHTISDTIDTSLFYLHYHEHYEILLFLEGDSKFIVEEKSFSLNPHDIIVVHKNELHRIFHYSNSRYHRYIISIFPQFFKQYNCPQYEEIFLNSAMGNKINAEAFPAKEIYNILMKLMKYSNNLTELNTPIAPALITEILYLLNNTDSYVSTKTKNKALENILTYLNENFTNNIRLDDLENKFFLSKHYICHAFKSYTGLTINQYMTKKKLFYVRELVQNGAAIGEAASLAGFNSYTSFYRAYVKEYNRSPNSEFGNL